MTELNVVHELLVERRRLLADGVREKAERLRKIDTWLKDAIDDAGLAIVDEELGLKVDYERKSQKVWDARRLSEVLRPEHLAEVLETIVVAGRLDELVGAGRYTDRELRRCYDLKPMRGPIRETPLARGRP